MKDIELLLGAFIRWKKAKKIKVGSRLGYGSKEEFRSLINKGFFFSDQRVEDNKIKNWYHISESGVKILQEFENVGLTLMHFSDFESSLNSDMKSKIQNIFNDFEYKEHVA